MWNACLYPPPPSCLSPSQGRRSPWGPHYHLTRTFAGTEIDGLAIALITDAAICITVLRMSNDLRQNWFPRGADEHYICPRGKHGCAVKFQFSESE